MKSKQKMTVVFNPPSIKKINEDLEKGWKVKQVVPLGDTGQAIVILEKEEEKEKEKKLGFK